MQAPIRFTSAIPGAIAQRQGDQQALQQFFDRNKVEKARMEQIKSLKQLAKGYGASAAQIESSSYGELQGFVKRMELEKADETRAEQTRLRELQMQQAQQAMELAGEQASREAALREDKRSLFKGLLASPGEQLTPEGRTLTRELEGYEQAAPTFIDSMRAAGMSPDQLAKIKQGQAAQIASFRDRLAFDPSMRSPLPSSAEKMFPGRPQIQAFLRRAVEEEQNPQLAVEMAAKMADRLTAADIGEREMAIKERSANYAGLTAGLDFNAALLKPTADLRKEFLALPSVKDFNKVHAAYEKVMEAAKGTGPADDIALIFGYMKILDPGSTVREGEFATAADAGGIDTKIINLYNRLKTGQRLTPDQRKDFLISAQKTAQSQFDELAGYVDFYSAVAGRQGAEIEGIVPANFLEIRRSGLAKTRAANAPGGAAPTTSPTSLPGAIALPGGGQIIPK